MKDTVPVPPFQTTAIDWKAYNPGLCIFHCHNVYHVLDGLMQILRVN